MTATGDNRPIIIKKKKVVVSGGHHGGAWKVAYADFVTAMMAFFLLMWLLGATDEKMRRGLADYFNPTLAISRNSAGGSGMLEGTAAFEESPTSGTREEGVLPKPTRQDEGPQLGDEDAGPETPPDATPAEFIANGIAGDGDTPVGDTAGIGAVSADGKLGENIEGSVGLENGLSEADAAALAAKQSEQARLEAVSRQIAEAMLDDVDGELQNHFFLRITADGLVIEIVDADDQPLFGSGSSEPAPILPVLIDILVPVLAETLNDIAVVGHTDAVPFGGTDYSNWELSTDRANAARRLLIAQGLPDGRVVRVTGKAAVEPLVADPKAPQNRRISITLLRNSIR